MEFPVTVVKKQDQVDHINYLHANPSRILWNWKTNLKSGFAMQNNVIMIWNYFLLSINILLTDFCTLIYPSWFTESPLN